MTIERKRKPLNQADYKMQIIADLGIKAVPGVATPQRMGIFECTECQTHVERNVQNAKKALYCKECATTAQKAAVSKPLIQSDFNMRIVEDLGMLKATPTSTKANRFAMFECTDCLQPFKARATGAVAKAQLTCKECANRCDRMHKHKLYPVWNGIKQRCYSPARKDYNRYGAIGVAMADEWKDDPTAFITWCEANGWEHGLAVDKDIKCRELNISPAIYSPETVTFVTPSANTREANGRLINQYTLEGEFVQAFTSAIEAGESLGLASGDSITNTCKQRQQTSAGFKWAYADV